MKQTAKRSKGYFRKAPGKKKTIWKEENFA